jgi:hypothetical protein
LASQDRRLALAVVSEGARPARAEAALQQVLRTSKNPNDVALAQQLLQDLSSRSCFAAGTPLLTPTGAKRVEAFQPGDVILSRSEHDPEGPLEAKVVEAVYVGTAAVLELRVGGRVIRTTAEHPFYVRGQGWVPAGRLQEGDELASPDGRWTAVQEVSDICDVTTVYNLRVADYHTYFVGCEEWGFSVWAHNFNCGDLADLLGLAKDDARVAKAWAYLTENANPSRAGLERILKEGGQTLPRSTNANKLLPQSERLDQAIAKTKEIRDVGPLFAKVDSFAKVKVPEGVPFTNPSTRQGAVELVNSLPPFKGDVYGILVVDGKAYYLKSGLSEGTERIGTRTFTKGVAKNAPDSFGFQVSDSSFAHPNPAIGSKGRG